MFDANIGTSDEAKPLIGYMWINEDETRAEIVIYREHWAKHLAYGGGLNIFWLTILYAFFKCFVANQFDSSIRQEVNPTIVAH